MAVPHYSPQVRSVFVIAAPLPRCQTSVLGLMGRAQPSRFRFDLHPKSVFFHSGLPPFSLGLSSNPLGCEPAVPKPIRKLSRKGGARGKISAPNVCASEAISCGEMATYVTSSWGSAWLQCWLHRSRSKACRWLAVGKMPYGGGADIENCRDGQLILLSLRKRQSFLDKLKGRCFNCFARVHLHPQCREPTKCWRCERPGHTSSVCSRAPAKRLHSGSSPSLQ
jgi:hypothetical protein